jgi:hypothetical protein
VNNPLRGKLDDEKEIERTKPKVADGQEVARPGVLGVILEEGRPGLRERLGWTNAGDVFLDDPFRDRETKFEQFPMNPFRTPKQVFLGHLLNQSNRITGQPGTTATVTGFEFPEEPKALPMPAQQRFGFWDQESFFPVLDATGQENEPTAIRLCEMWRFDLALEDDELLTEQGVFGDEVDLTPR